MTPNNFQITNQHFQITQNFLNKWPLAGDVYWISALKKAWADLTFEIFLECLMDVGT